MAIRSRNSVTAFYNDTAMPKKTEFERLMEEVSAGSEEAIWQLADAYTPYIIRSVRLSLSPKLRQKLDSQDIAQTLWASLLLGRADLGKLKSPERLIAFLARAARNKVIDRTRQLHTLNYDVSREQRLEDVAVRRSTSPRDVAAKPLYSRDATPSKLVSVRERWDSIVSTASKRDRRILELRLQGCSFDDIGNQVQISAMTARRAIEHMVGQLVE